MSDRYGVGVASIFEDDEPGDTQPLFSPMNLGCHAGSRTMKAIRGGSMDGDDEATKPRSYRYTWTPGQGSGVEKPAVSKIYGGVSIERKDASSSDKAEGSKTTAALAKWENERAPSRFGYNAPGTGTRDRADFYSGSVMGYNPPTTTYPYKPREEVKFLFVYDCLPGSLMEAMLRRDGFIRRVKTKPDFRLFDMGNFPGMACYGATAVEGDLYPAVPRTIKFLDNMKDTHGPFRKDTITLEDGTKAYAYVLGGTMIPSGQDRVIPSGSWSSWQKGRRARIRAEKEAMRLAQERRDAERAQWEAWIQSNRDADTGKQRIHISGISAMELRLMLRENNFDVDNMNDREVRVEAIKNYGFWYLVGA